MADEKVKKQRTPRDVKAILNGLYSLSLEERVNVCKELKENIAAEIKAKQEAVNQAEKLLQGL